MLLWRTLSTHPPRVSGVLARRLSSSSSTAGPTREEIFAVRKGRRARLKSSARKSNPQQGWKTLAVIGAGAGVCSVCYFYSDRVSEVLRGSPLDTAGRWITAQWDEIASPFTNTNREELLSSWPPPGVPAHVPAPPTLVLDLDGTLVSNVWDRKRGWRVAKRPGVDEFLKEMCLYYEIVIQTDQNFGTAEPIIASLTKDLQAPVFPLFRESTKYVKGRHIKDISKLNRPVPRIVVVDKDEKNVSLAEHVIKIVPYKAEEEGSQADRSLVRLIPFLRAIAMEDVSDVRPILAQYKDMNSDDIADAYAARVRARQVQKKDREKRGLGGLVRGSGLGGQHHAPHGGTSAKGGAMPTSKDIVGGVSPVAPDMGPNTPKVAPPPAREEAGAFWKGLRRRMEEAGEDSRVKQEKWQQVMEEKDRRRKQKAEEGGSKWPWQ